MTHRARYFIFGFCLVILLCVALGYSAHWIETARRRAGVVEVVAEDCRNGNVPEELVFPETDYGNLITSWEPSGKRRSIGTFSTSEETDDIVAFYREAVALSGWTVTEKSGAEAKAEWEATVATRENEEEKRTGRKPPRVSFVPAYLRAWELVELYAPGGQTRTIQIWVVDGDERREVQLSMLQRYPEMEAEKKFRDDQLKAMKYNQEHPPSPLR